MRNRKIVNRICALALAASLAAVDPMPAFAAMVSEISAAGEEVVFLEAAETENIAGTETAGETETEPETETELETESGGQEKVGGLIYADDMLYSGYYIDNAGIFCIVTEGLAYPFTGIVSAGVKYYSCDNTGGMIPMTLSGQLVFVEGKAYTGYYMDSGKKMYYVKKGKRTLKTGILKAKMKYYSYNTGKMQKLSKQTLYVKGERYSGYYMSKANKMNRVKKGKLTLKTGAVKKGTKYFNYNTKKMKTLSRQTLYVKGKVYNGYYLDKKNRMYSVKKGTQAIKTGVVKKGTRYYGYNPKKTKKLSKDTLYVKGKVYDGYYLDDKNEMYRVKKGSLTLVTGVMGKETMYYSYQSRRNEKLSRDALYVDGKVYSGYCLGNDNKMYTVSDDICTPVNGMLSAGTAYYSGAENKMTTLPGHMILCIWKSNGNDESGSDGYSSKGAGGCAVCFTTDRQ